MQPEKTSSRKNERLQQLEQEKRMRRLLIIVPVVVGFIALAVFGFFRLWPVEDITDFGSEDRRHDVGATISASPLPPVGSVHDPLWQNCGKYIEPVDTGLAVPSLGHGAVWTTNRPDLPADDVAVLK